MEEFIVINDYYCFETIFKVKVKHAIYNALLSEKTVKTNNPNSMDSLD